MAHPTNDQSAAAARDDLNWHIKSTRRTLRDAAQQGVDEIDALATIAATLIMSEEDMPRERVCSLLAVAMLRFVHLEDANGEASDRPM